MKIDEWVVREVIDTLHQANITLFKITGLDSPQEIAKKLRRMRLQSIEGLCTLLAC